MVHKPFTNNTNNSYINSIILYSNLIIKPYKPTLKMKNLNKTLAQICTLSNQVMSYDDAISKGKDRYLTIEHNSNYGGYRLVNVSVDGAGHGGAFSESASCARRPIKQMASYLDGILYGLEYSAKRI